MGFIGKVPMLLKLTCTCCNIMVDCKVVLRVIRCMDTIQYDKYVQTDYFNQTWAGSSNLSGSH